MLPLSLLQAGKRRGGSLTKGRLPVVCPPLKWWEKHEPAAVAGVNGCFNGQPKAQGPIRGRRFEAVRRHAPAAPVIFASTNKVYG